MAKQFLYRLKIILSDKSLLFWTLLFPMTLALFFNLTIRNAFEIKPIEVMPLASVNVSNVEVQQFLNTLEEDYSLIQIKDYPSKDAALVDLENGSIQGIVEYNNQINLTVTENKNSNATIIANVFASYNNKQAIIQEQLQVDASKVTPEFIDELVNSQAYLDAKLDSKINDIAMINMYSTIAMMCIYASQWGGHSGYYMQADKSKLAIRTSTSPTKKGHIVLMDLAVVYLIFIVEFIIHILFLKYALNVSMGSQPLILIITGMIGGLLSAAMGYMLSVSFTDSESTFSYLVSGIGVLLSFLSGMMSVDVKYFIDTNLPIVNKLNPAALITDNFYNSYMGMSVGDSLVNIMIMAVMTLVFGFIAYRRLRTVSYDSV